MRDLRARSARAAPLLLSGVLQPPDQILVGRGADDVVELGPVVGDEADVLESGPVRPDVEVREAGIDRASAGRMFSILPRFGIPHGLFPP